MLNKSLSSFPTLTGLPGRECQQISKLPLAIVGKPDKELQNTNELFDQPVPPPVLKDGNFLPRHDLSRVQSANLEVGVTVQRDHLCQQLLLLQLAAAGGNEVITIKTGGSNVVFLTDLHHHGLVLLRGVLRVDVKCNLQEVFPPVLLGE